MKALLLTRPVPSARQTIERLEALGWPVTYSPLYMRDELLYVVEDKPYQAILLTSGLAAFALRGALAQRPIYVTGDGTAMAAHAVGATDITSADGDASALFDLIKTTLKPEDGPLLYLAGKERAFDMPAKATEAGFTLDLVEVYGMAATGPLLPEVLQALHNGEVAATLLYSAHTAQRFRALIDAAGVDVGQHTIVCLSQRVADAAGAGWQAVHVAAHPNEPSLFDQLSSLPGGPVLMTETPEDDNKDSFPPFPVVSYVAPERKGHKLALSVAVIALLAAIASPLVYSEIKGYAPAADTSALEGKIEQLETKLSEMSRSQAQLATALTAYQETTSGSTAPDPALAEHVERLSRQVADLAVRPQAVAPDDSALKDELASLTAQVVTLRAKSEEETDHKPLQELQAKSQADRMRALTLMQLNTALQSGEPLRTPWGMLQNLPHDVAPQLTDALQAANGPLGPYLTTGVPTTATLHDRFAPLAREAIKLAAPKPEGWLDGALNQTKSLVTIRRQGELEGDDAEAVLARAETRLQSGNLRLAIEELAKLPTEATPAFTEWLGQARARLVADQLILQIQDEFARDAIAAPAAVVAPVVIPPAPEQPAPTPEVQSEEETGTSP